MQQTDNNTNKPAPPPKTYGMKQAQPKAVQQPQETDAPTGSSGDSDGVLAARIILGIVCGLVLAVTVHQIITSVVMLMPPGFADAFDFVTFAMTRLIDVLFPLVLAVPPVILLVYAIRKKAVSNRASRIALIAWWATWVVGLAAYLIWARDAVVSDLLLQIVLRHLASAAAPIAATVCLIIIQRKGEDIGGQSTRTESVFRAVPQPPHEAMRQEPQTPPAQLSAPQEALEQETPTPSGGSGMPAARAALGVVCGIVLVACALGLVLYVGSALEEANLAQSGASGSEYMGTIVGGVVGILLLVPAVPAILLLVFAARPTRSTYVAAIVALALWWTLWVFATGALLILSRTGIDALELAFMFAGLLAIAIPPAVSTLCVYLASRGLGQTDVKGAHADGQ